MVVVVVVGLTVSHEARKTGGNEGRGGGSVEGLGFTSAPSNGGTSGAPSPASPAVLRHWLDMDSKKNVALLNAVTATPSACAIFASTSAMVFLHRSTSGDRQLRVLTYR